MQGKSADAPEFDRFVRAQQTWDRAFACSIAAYLNEQPEALVAGIIGRGHMEYGFGTPDQLDDLWHQSGWCSPDRRCGGCGINAEGRGNSGYR